jgi:hypothetical protein
MPDPAPVLAALDRLLAERPEQVTHDFSAAMRCLTDWREVLVRRVRAAGDDSAADRHLYASALRQLNAVVSAVYAGHYPLGRTDWELLSQARDSFAAIAASVQRR